ANSGAPAGGYVCSAHGGPCFSTRRQVCTSDCPIPKTARRHTTRRYLGYAYARSRRREDAERLVAIPDPAQLRQQLQIFAGLGDAERTLDAMSKMAAEHDPAVSLHTVFPDVAFLRGHPRYKEFRHKLNLPELQPTR